jgi:hypothetical protein
MMPSACFVVATYLGRNQASLRLTGAGHLPWLAGCGLNLDFLKGSDRQYLIHFGKAGLVLRLTRQILLTQPTFFQAFSDGKSPARFLLTRRAFDASALIFSPLPEVTFRFAPAWVCDLGCASRSPI